MKPWINQNQRKKQQKKSEISFQLEDKEMRSRNTPSGTILMIKSIHVKQIHFFRSVQNKLIVTQQRKKDRQKARKQKEKIIYVKKSLYKITTRHINLMMNDSKQN